MKWNKRDLIVGKLLTIGVHEGQSARIGQGVLGLAVDKNKIILIHLINCERNRRRDCNGSRSRAAKLKSLGRRRL